MPKRELTEAEIKSLYGKMMSARRKIVASTCIVCGKPIEGTTKRRYCSNTCAARKYRERKRQTELPQQADARDTKQP